MWQDHLVQVSKLFVQHTKLFMRKNGVHTEGRNGVRKHQVTPRVRQLDGYDSDFEGKASFMFLRISTALTTGRILNLICHKRILFYFFVKYARVFFSWYSFFQVCWLREDKCFGSRNILHKIPWIKSNLIDIYILNIMTNIEHPSWQSICGQWMLLDLDW